MHAVTTLWHINKWNVCFSCLWRRAHRVSDCNSRQGNLRCFAPNPVQMGCLNVGLEKLKIVHKATLHQSPSSWWQPAEREQTTSLFLNTEGDAGRALTFTETPHFFFFFFLLSQDEKLFRLCVKKVKHRQFSQYRPVDCILKSKM